jgi:ribosomal protein L37AE/L43A
MATDGKLHFPCPHCHRSVSVAVVHAGKRGKCPGCGKAIQAPANQPEPDFDTLVERSMEELRIKTAAHDGIWQLSKAVWDLDQDAETITFTSRNGMTATCPVQIIGTYNTADGTFMWGWDHPSVEPALQKHAKIVRAYGEQHGIALLTSPKIACGKDDAWQLTAFACKLADAQGGYCGPAGATLVYVTFGTPRVSKPRRGRS